VIKTAAGPVPRVSKVFSGTDRIGAFKVRWGIRRTRYRVDAGLYAIGEPTAESPVFVTATGEGTGGRYARGAEGVLLISPGTAEIAGSPRLRLRDDNGDGSYDRLEVQVAVGVQQAGDFLLAAQLLDAAGAVIGASALPVALSAGLQWVPLSFPGSWIHAHQVGGPYTVGGILLLEANGAAVPLDEAAKVDTPVLRWQDFSP